MKNPLQFDPGEIPLYAFCEPSYASSWSRWHIRPINPNTGLKLSGGIDTESLCGRIKPFGSGGHGGWDLNVRIDEHHSNHSCAECVAEYKRRVT